MLIKSNSSNHLPVNYSESLLYKSKQISGRSSPAEPLLQTPADVIKRDKFNEKFTLLNNSFNIV